jgi:molybdenum cofactor synthesis domain-containing protein
MLQEIAVKDAVGMVLGHDVTRIIPGQEKGPAFRRGHIIREDDVGDFLDIGKEHVYVFDLDDGYLHEDEAARRIATAAAGAGIRLTPPTEGRINLEAEIDGLLKIDTDALARLNGLGEITFATLHSNHQVKADQPIAGTRIVPLVMATETVARAVALCREAPPLIQVKAFRPLRVGMVTTGSEVYSGRIKDTFGPVVEKKFAALGSQIMRQVFVSDEVEMTRDAILDLIKAGAEMVVVTGGMSVDPDDRTPLAIREAGGETISYGAPTFPGAMFMLAWIDDIPVMGLPGCVMYYNASVFDLVVPRLLAGERVSRDEIASMGHGGFCAGCSVCRYPVCGFGKC